MNVLQNYLLQLGNLAASPQPVITLLYDQLPWRKNWKQVLPALKHVAGLSTEPELSVEQNWADGHPLLARLKFDDHALDLVGLNAPLPPDVLDRCIWSTAWRTDLKELMASHRSSLMLRYTGSNPDPVEQHLALYRVASLFDDDLLLGVVNEPAWTSHPAPLVHNLVQPELRDVIRESPPWLYWTGFLRLELGDMNWFFSRGHHLFGQPDLAMAILPDGLDPQDIQDTFHDILTYYWDLGHEPLPGNALAVNEDRAFEFYDLEPELDALKPVTGHCLIVHPLQPGEWGDETDHAGANGHDRDE